ncbi:S8 family peptidase [Paenibacillus sp. 19GGS1-52]|uniref:S8 family peptidase n=1 Tax=Paenibacillus sp. 19GGS1-52 TaxID=2758563 RepID=UPI001EFA3B37|nr:S8 family peptidase [Paenibacillus sp. 19GGS1-52]ULO05834.1 S8 family peptidase [Paenibacillus sp. 19GGS1-52]
MNGQIWLQKNTVTINRPLRKKIQQAYLPGRKQVEIPVIIQFKQKITSVGLRALQKRLGQHSFPIIRRLPLLNAVSSNVSVKCLEQMCNCHEVQKIYLDSIKKTSLYIATPSIGSTALQRKKGLTGKGINIAILDTGVFAHPDLTQPVNRIIAFKDYINHRKQPYDDNGHGTHIAGDAAGNGWMSKGKYRGPAPEAGIVSVKVLDSNGYGYDSTIIKGIEWCITQRKRLKLRILSLSLGGPVNSTCEDDPLCQAVEKAVQAGLIVVIAAGNSGPGRGTIESPGNSPAAITVGAVDDHRSLRQADDRITWYSSRGPTLSGQNKPDLVAPGETIISLRAPCSRLNRELPYLRIGKGYFVLSGTSISTPIVSGAAAQLLQHNPSLSPSQVKALLKRKAFRLGLQSNTAGSGEINVRFLLRCTKASG